MFMTKNKKVTLGELELRDLVDLGLRMPDGSTELFEVVNVNDGLVALMTKNIIDFMPFNSEDSWQTDKANSYAKSSVRLYLVRLYQAIAKENKVLEANTVGNKEFFLPTGIALGLLSDQYFWRAFKDNASRIKCLGTFASTRDMYCKFGKADRYWTSSPINEHARSVSVVDSDGALCRDYVHYDDVGVAPAVILKSLTPVILIDGVWHLCNNSSEALGDKSHNIKTGDWVEVIHTVEMDTKVGILLGDCLEVTSVNAGGEFIVKLSPTESWYLLPDQVRKIEPPLPYYKKSKETAEFSERLKGYYQHTAIEVLKVYHTAHKVKEERTKALNKVIENIQELIKLENE